MDEAIEVCRRLLEQEAVIRGALVLTSDSAAKLKKFEELVEIATRVVRMHA